MEGFVDSFAVRGDSGREVLASEVVGLFNKDEDERVRWSPLRWRLRWKILAGPTNLELRRWRGAGVSTPVETKVEVDGRRIRAERRRLRSLSGCSCEPRDAAWPIVLDAEMEGSGEGLRRKVLR